MLEDVGPRLDPEAFGALSRVVGDDGARESSGMNADACEPEGSPEDHALASR